MVMISLVRALTSHLIDFTELFTLSDIIKCLLLFMKLAPWALWP